MEATVAADEVEEITREVVVVGSEVVDSEEEEEVSFVDYVVAVLLIHDDRCGIRWYADAWVSGRDGEEATWISG
jgi:hypothetical protein